MVPTSSVNRAAVHNGSVEDLAVELTAWLSFFPRIVGRHSHHVSQDSPSRRLGLSSMLQRRTIWVYIAMHSLPFSICVPCVLRALLQGAAAKDADLCTASYCRLPSPSVASAGLQRIYNAAIGATDRHSSSTLSQLDLRLLSTMPAAVTPQPVRDPVFFFTIVEFQVRPSFASLPKSAFPRPCIATAAILYSPSSYFRSTVSCSVSPTTSARSPSPSGPRSPTRSRVRWKM